MYWYPGRCPWLGTGCPFRALLFALCSFIMYACFATCCLAKKNVQRFFWILNTVPLILVELKNKFDILHILGKGGFLHLRLTDNTNSVLVSEPAPRRDRTCSQTRPNLLPDTLASAPAFAEWHRSWTDTSTVFLPNHSFKPKFQARLPTTSYPKVPLT